MSQPLTDQERDRFATWLEQEAKTDESLIEQLEKLGPGMALASQVRRREVAAALLIAQKLRRTFGETLS